MMTITPTSQIRLFMCLSTQLLLRLSTSRDFCRNEINTNTTDGQRLCAAWRRAGNARWQANCNMSRPLGPIVDLACGCVFGQPIFLLNLANQLVALARSLFQVILSLQVAVTTGVARRRRSNVHVTPDLV